MVSSSGCARGPAGPSSRGADARDASASQPDATRLDQRFPRSCRLTDRRQFLAVYGRGWRVGTRSLVLYGVPSPAGHTRLGVTVSRKVGGSVERNRVKRLLREAFRRNRVQLGGPPVDLVINARPGTAERTAGELERELVDGLARLARRMTP